jgi:hypothetical protein
MRRDARPASTLTALAGLALVPLVALAERATGGFRRTFRAARYEAIPEVHALLTAACAADPRDPRLALLLGQLHFWKAAEGARASGDPTIVDHRILAERFLDEAARLARDDPRIPGWLGGSFTFPLISQPPGSPQLQEAVAAMWETMELCNREQYGQHRTATGRTRVCGNTPLVPRNMEGFFPHFGDLLLRAGHEAAALRDDDPANDPPYMLRSALSCTGCHAS